MNESMFVAIDDQNASLTTGGTGFFPIICFPLFCWPVNHGKSDARADAGSAAYGKNTNATTYTNTVVDQGNYSKANSISTASAS